MPAADFAGALRYTLAALMQSALRCVRGATDMGSIPAPAVCLATSQNPTKTTRCGLKVQQSRGMHASIIQSGQDLFKTGFSAYPAVGSTLFASHLTVRGAAQDIGQAESQLFRLLGQPLTARQGFAWQPGDGTGLHRGADVNPGGGQKAFRTPGFRLHLGVQALQFLVALTKVRQITRGDEVRTGLLSLVMLLAHGGRSYNCWHSTSVWGGRSGNAQPQDDQRTEHDL